MTLNIKEDVKAAVKQDRLDGLSLNQLVNKWKHENVTKDWIRRNTEASSTEESLCRVAIDRIKELSTRDAGITASEFISTLADVFGVDDNGTNVNVTDSQSLT